MEPKLLTSDRFVNKAIGCSYRYVISTTEYFRPHFHDFYELFVMLDGDAIHIVNGEKIKIKKANIVFIRPNDVHDYVCEQGKPFSMMNITFDSKTANELFGFLGEGFPTESLLNTPLPPQTQMTASELDWFNSRMESIRAIPENENQKIKTSLRILLFRLFTRHFSDFSQKNSSMPLWVDNLLEEMKLDGNYVYGTERMLELCDKSREHIARSIKKYTGMSASEYVNDLRLNYIANMLKNSNHSISDIIFESGFGNISWASEKFKEKFGVTMTKYRKNIKP